VFDWILSVIGRGGLAGLALLMFLENLVPPIPSELIMPLAGFEAARGRFSFAGVVAAGTAGSLAGAVFWYEVGRRVGCERLSAWAERHGRWLALSGDDVARATGWFERHGGWAVFLGRLAPGVRTFISVPAGVAAMPWLPFLGWTLAGTTLWTTLLAGAGFLLNRQYEHVERWTNPAANLVFGALAVLYLYRVVTWKRRRRRPAPRGGEGRRRGSGKCRP
jgi:membrane protein DedA with SNARE-associated domain